MATGDDAVTVLLAEYTALRAEIGWRSQTQQSAAVLCVTASGAIAAYALPRNLMSVLLLQPMLAGLLGLMYAGHGNAISNIGSYLHGHTAAIADELTERPGLLGWERKDKSHSRPTPKLIWLIPHVMIFIGSALLTLALTAQAVWGTYVRSNGALDLSALQARILFVVDALVIAMCAWAFLYAFGPGRTTDRPRRHADD